MGQRCSCLFQKEGEQVFINDREAPTTNLEGEQSKGEEIYNLEYSKAMFQKSGGGQNPQAPSTVSGKEVLNSCIDNNISESGNLNQYNTSNLHNNEKHVKFIIKIQNYFRTFKMMKYFKKTLKSLLIENLKQKLAEVEGTYKNANVIEKESKIPPYDKNGWKELYNPHSEKFKIDYGKYLQTKLFIKYLNKDNKNLSYYYIGGITKDNKKQGYGKRVSADGAKMEGFWYEDSFLGWGRIIESDGTFSEGYFSGEQLMGKGRRSNLKGLSHTGNFNKNIKEGFGKEEVDDQIYEGEFKNGKKNGKGKLLYKSTGDIYEGEFTDNLVTGTGLYTWANQDTYLGTFQNGKMHGSGLYKWPDGGEYEGDYVENLKEGQGRFKWANGRIFEGPFKAGKPHGAGKLTNNGKIMEVEFIDGKINKDYKKKPRSNNAKEGKLEEIEKQGRGNRGPSPLKVAENRAK
jgi:hypothetical protein